MAVVMDRAALFALRRTVAAIEERPAETLGGVALRRFGGTAPSRLSTGVPRFDAALGGGLPATALTEIRTGETRQAAAAAGFALMLATLGADDGRPLIWVAAAGAFAEAGLPHAPGLAALAGHLPLIVAPTRRLSEALWIAEEAAASGAARAVLVETRGDVAGLDLTATRRLDRRAQAAARPVLLIRHAAQAQPTAAPVRLAVAAAPFARGDPLFPFGAAFTVAVEKSPAARPATLFMEWTPDDRRFRDAAPDHGAVVSPPVGRPRPPPASRPVMAHERRRA